MGAVRTTRNSSPRLLTRRRTTALHGDVTISRVHHGEEEVRVSSLAGAEGRPFLLVAGIGVASDYYIRLAVDLKTAGDVHAIDLPGFAGVPRRAHHLGIDDFADLTEAVIDELGLEDPILIGHSMGSQVVTEVAARRPELSTLILIGPVINDQERSIVKQAVRLVLCAGHEPFAITLHVLLSYVLCGPKWFLRVLPHMMGYPIEVRIAEVRAHTLILRGEHDGNSPRAWALRLARLTQHARAWEIPDAAHSVMYAHAHEVATICLEHLSTPHGEHDDQSVERHTGDHKTSTTATSGTKPTLAKAVRALLGGLTSLIGMARRDDESIAAGAAMQAESMEDLRENDPRTPVALEAGSGSAGRNG